MQLNERHTVYAASGRATRLPISASQFRSLLRYVDELCSLHGCDGSLAHSRGWARANDVAWTSLGRSLRGLGGYCDCEVGMNVVEPEPDDAEPSDDPDYLRDDP